MEIKESRPINCCSSAYSVPAAKGHIVLYTSDQRRFVVPLVYLNNEVFKELLALSAEEYGLPSNGPITLPCEAPLMEHIINSIQQAIAKSLEKQMRLSLLLPAALIGTNNVSSYVNYARRFLVEDDQSQGSVDKARGYLTNSDLEKAVKEFGERCSSISRIYSIGKSVNGFPLWVIEISDKPGAEEPEPAFKYIGNVHGDEPVGRELLIHLANWICDNYLKDPLARLIVENVHLHILPSMNPDGFSLRRRGNANNVDLNRDFPDQFFPLNGDINSRQPETRAIMNWLGEIHFTASASLHGGALVANYPWDGTGDKRRNYYACPDDDTFQFMASIYSRSHRNMSLSTEFPGGITNGASWYPIYGGMQDWNYIHADCFELTLEISDNKWPNAEEIKAGSLFADYHRLLNPAERYEVVASMPVQIKDHMDRVRRISHECRLYS
ncbi:hypothetical protein GH714_019831 [Hevea brasiliensis]|uniref:Peptidase M14 domain-containing protein n=1 Tax=Hevea brasiliensis TaxID=3981 RepID=A0A6A6KQ01_HEVBR|nr:hypothetical protein GH714_019831 [Hevea brasiliensis]